MHWKRRRNSWWIETNLSPISLGPVNLIRKNKKEAETLDRSDGPSHPTDRHHVHFDRFSPEEVEAVVPACPGGGVYRVIAVAMGRRPVIRFSGGRSVIGLFGAPSAFIRRRQPMRGKRRVLSSSAGIAGDPGGGEVGLPYYSLPEGTLRAAAAAVRRLRRFSMSPGAGAAVSLHAVHAMAAPALRLLKHRVNAPSSTG